MSARTATLELERIQGVVLRGYRLPLASFSFVTLPAAAAARGWLSGLLAEVTTAARWDAKPASTLNLAFTAAGLTALGVPDGVLAGFGIPFTEGMAARAAALGDTGSSAPGCWQDGFGTGRIHALVWVHARDAGTLAGREAQLATGFERHGVRVVSRLDAGLLPDGREHFGFADGLSQPDVEGLDGSPRTGLGALAADGQRPIRPGEFVFGYPTEEDVLPDTGPDALTRNGSLLVFRKLRQDVAAFRALTRAHAHRFPGGAEQVAAKLVGRRQDGTPLAAGPAPNGFTFADDPDGYACPPGAHVRRANPRLALPFDGKLVNRHRIIRRGMPYGPPLPAGADEDGADRGLAFACFQTDLERQFEFVQGQWLDDGDAFGLGTAKDPLLGEGGGTMVVPGEPPVFIRPVPRLVTTAGGEYLFAPGTGGLRRLAGQTAGAA